MTESTDRFDATKHWADIRKSGDLARASAEFSAKAIAARIMCDTDTDELEGMFTAARSDFLSAKQGGLKTTPITEDWGKFAKLARHHISPRGFAVYFPNLKTGTGAESRPDHIILVAKAQDSADTKAKKIEQDERDRTALAQRQDDVERAKIEAIKAMSALDIANSVRQMCEISGCSLDSVLQVLTGEKISSAENKPAARKPAAKKVLK